MNKDNGMESMRIEVPQEMEEHIQTLNSIMGTGNGVEEAVEGMGSGILSGIPNEEKLELDQDWMMKYLMKNGWPEGMERMDGMDVEIKGNGTGKRSRLELGEEEEEEEKEGEGRGRKKRRLDEGGMETMSSMSLSMSNDPMSLSFSSSSSCSPSSSPSFSSSFSSSFTMQLDSLFNDPAFMIPSDCDRNDENIPVPETPPCSESSTEDNGSPQPSQSKKQLTTSMNASLKNKQTRWIQIGKDGKEQECRGLQHDDIDMTKGKGKKTRHSENEANVFALKQQCQNALENGETVTVRGSEDRCFEYRLNSEQHVQCRQINIDENGDTEALNWVDWCTSGKMCRIRESITRAIVFYWCNRGSCTGYQHNFSVLATFKSHLKNCHEKCLKNAHGKKSK